MKLATLGLLVAATLSGGVGAANAACTFGECTPAPAPVAPQQATWRTLATYGQWTVQTDGDAVRLMKQIDADARLGLLKIDDTVAFVLQDRNWGLQEGTRYEGTITIDGRIFRFRAVAVNATTVAFPNMPQEVVHAFFSGAEVDVLVAGQTWHVALAGAGEAVRLTVDH